MSQSISIDTNPGLRRDLIVVAFFQNESIRSYFAKLIRSSEVNAQQDLEIPNYAIQFEDSGTLENAADRLSHHLGSRDDIAAILISDSLVRQIPARGDAAWELVPTAKVIRDKFAQKLYVSVAVLQQSVRIPNRISNIDLVLRSDCTAPAWLDALKLLTARLSYLARPEKCPRPKGIEVRSVQSQTELYEAFRLRYAVYKVMGYLDEEIEKSGANLELHWCDTIALHFGAFLPRGNGTELVGTSRLITTSGPYPYDTWTKFIARAHPQLRLLFKNQQAAFAPWRLPIFHTMELNKYIRKVFLRGEIAGELSRVIVREGWRGTGLSSELVNVAIAKADACGVHYMFLECLEIHEEYYNKFGFTALGRAGEVVGIGKTMIGMGRTAKAKETPFPLEALV